MDIADFLQANPLLRDSGAVTLSRLSGARRRRLSARQVLFQHGDAADAVYLLLSGRISICVQTVDGRQMALNTVAAGQMIGDIAVLDGQPRSASAIALSAAELAVIPRADFLRMIDDDPLLARAVIGRLCQELRRVSERVAADGFLDVQAALAHRLLAQAQAVGQVVDISQEDLAQSVGVSRITANKYLNQWRAKGWVGLARGRITVRDGAPLSGLIEQQFDGARLEGG